MRRFLVAMIALGVASVALTSTVQRAAAQAPVGAYVDELIFFEQPNAAVALQQVSQGNEMQMYMFNLRTLADKLAALDDPNVWTVQTPGSVNDLWINPVPYAPTVAGYNPFTLQAVRQAMNFLVDRQFIINEIYGGFGLPYVSPWHQKMPEYRRDSTFFGGLDSDFSYDPARANTMITNALNTVPGMDKSSGKWMYDNDGAGGNASAPVTLKFVIRTEDVRLDIGNYVANQLESVGFTVIRNYSPAAQAFAVVYNGPPDTWAWNLYTEGFAFTSLQAWQDSWLADFYTDDSGEAIWAQYDAPVALENAAYALRDGNYADLNARKALIETGSRLAVEDGVRVWMVAENAVFIYSKLLTAAVNDLMAGPWGLYTTRTVRYGDPGGTVKIGQPVHWNSPWNTDRGFTWLYDATQQRALSDLGVGLNPVTGLAVPVRATFSVQTAGPSGTPLSVPADAYVYNAGDPDGAGSTPRVNAFEAVAPGTTARTKVTYDFTFGKWHDGTDMKMDDVWYYISKLYRREGGTDRAVNPQNATQYPVGDIGKIDPRADSPGANFWLGLFKGARQTGPNTLEIYSDYWHIDTGFIGYNLDIWPLLPWHVHELMNAAVLANEARLDPTQATTDSKTVIDVIRGNTLTLMNAHLATLRAAGEIPPGMASPPCGAGCTITAAEASARWAALDAWRTAHNNYYVSNGPFYLDEAKIPVKQTIMKRFTSYPGLADRWESFIAPALPTVAIGNIPEIVPGQAASIPISTSISGSATSALNMSFVIRNVGLDQTALVGKPTTTGSGTWTISMDANTTARFVPGAHEITATAAVGELGIPVGTAKAFIVIPALVFFERLTNALQAQLGGLQSDLNTANGKLTTANSQIASLSGLLTASVVIAIIAVIVGVVGIVMAMRKGGRMKMPGAEPPTGENPPEQI